MTLSKALRYLLDVNVLIALLDEDHVYHGPVSKWFHSAGLQWAICAFTEAGLLRHMTRPKIGDMEMEDAVAMLRRFTENPGYDYVPISADWQTLTEPFSTRLHGHNQITDAYLLGLALREGLVLVTLDKGILHMAGKHREHVLLLGGSQTH